MYLYRSLFKLGCYVCTQKDEATMTVTQSVSTAAMLVTSLKYHECETQLALFLWTYEWYTVSNEWHTAHSFTATPQH
jgi:hypothetical protein